MAKMAKKQKTVKIFLYAFIILIAAGLIFLGRKLFFAASVNGQLISRLSVIRELEKQGGKNILDTIIIKTLINQEAKKRNISVSEKEVDAELAKIEKNISSQGATLDALLEQQGMTKNDLADEIKVQLLVTKMTGSNVLVTNKEIDDYLASQKDQSTPELTKDQAKAAIKQQKLQEKVQTFVADLKAKAKINYFIEY